MTGPTSPLKWSTRKTTSTSTSSSSNGPGLAQQHSLHKTATATSMLSLSQSQPTTPTKSGSTLTPTYSRPDTPNRSNSGKGKMRAVFVDVVVEGMESSSEGGWTIPSQINRFLPSLGTPQKPPTVSPAFPTTPSRASLSQSTTSPAAQPRTPDITKLRNVIHELLASEQEYVRRLATLYNLYAQPLRQFAQRKEEEIIPPFEARQIFGNIEIILPANQAYLKDLQTSLGDLPSGSRREHWASVTLRHLEYFANIYPTYMSNLENAKTIEREMRKRNSVFASFLERTQYSASSGHGNFNLESLLMEPLQRIPRYHLFLKRALRDMEDDDPARFDVEQAMTVAEQIANLDEDEETRRAAALWGLYRSIDGFPDMLINNRRYFVDCIDVLDTPLPPATVVSAPGSGYQYHTQDLFCTLFLFNDKIVIAKRESTDRTGRELAGLTDIHKLASDMRRQRSSSSSGLNRSPWKSKAKQMKFCGEMDLGELTARESSSRGFSLFLERPPTSFSDKWNDRPLRNFVIVKPETDQDKARFLSNIWQSYSHLKAQHDKSFTLLLKQQNLSVFWNLYDRKNYLVERRKAKIALQLISGDIDDHDLISLAASGPLAVARAIFPEDPMVDTCFFNVRTATPGADPAYTEDSPALLVRAILETALHLGLYDTPPRRLAAMELPDRGDSRTSSASRQLSASSNRPKSVIDFMLSPSGASGSPKRTLSKVSRSSTLDSRGAASIFSGDYASTTQTSIVSSTTGEEKRSSFLLRQGSHISASAPGRANGYTRPMRDENGYRALQPPTKPAGEERDKSLARSASLDSFEKPQRQSSLHRARSGTLSRSSSRQTMPIEERHEEEEEILVSHTPPRAMSPNNAEPMLSPSRLSRRGTVSKPFGPRQLGLKSPANSPRVLYPSAAPPGPTRTPSSGDEDPFLSREATHALSSSKKRNYEDEPDDSSVSSKRKLREMFEATVSGAAHPSTPERSGSPDKARAPSKSVTRDVAGKELTRVASLPRSPHTRNIFAQSRGLPASSSSASISKIPRKPVPTTPYHDDNASSENVHKPSEDVEMLEQEITLVRKQSREEKAKYDAENANLREQIATLKASLEHATTEIKSLQATVSEMEASKEKEIQELSDRASQLANDAIDQYASATETRMASLEAENIRLRNENRALQALLKKHRPTAS